jgi:hypothetical protein
VVGGQESLNTAPELKNSVSSGSFPCRRVPGCRTMRLEPGNGNENEVWNPICIGKCECTVLPTACACPNFLPITVPISCPRPSKFCACALPNFVSSPIPIACLLAAVPISRFPHRCLSSVRGKQREDARPTSQCGRGDMMAAAWPGH